MRIVVTGSRSWTNQDKVRDVFYSIADAVVGRPVTLVHGGARGLDQIAGEVAEYIGWEVEVFEADWDGQGKKAGVLRNIRMLDTRPTRVIAFWDGSSKGTRHCFEEAIKRGIPTDIYVRRP